MLRLLSISLLMFAGIQCIAAPVSCGEGMWQVTVDSHQQSAEIRKDEKLVCFGKLQCANIFTAEFRPEGSPFVQCWSPSVADAGFSLYLYRPHDKPKLEGKLEQISIVGSTQVAKFGQGDCVEVQDEQEIR